MLLGAYATYDTDRVKRRKNQESRRGKARWISPSKGFHCPRTVKKLGEWQGNERWCSTPSISQENHSHYGLRRTVTWNESVAAGIATCRRAHMLSTIISGPGWQQRPPIDCASEFLLRWHGRVLQRLCHYGRTYVSSHAWPKHGRSRKHIATERTRAKISLQPMVEADLISSQDQAQQSVTNFNFKHLITVQSVKIIYRSFFIF
jgi:hypothetical protein